MLKTVLGTGSAGEATAGTSFGTLADNGACGVLTGRSSGTSHWERHLGGEESVYVLGGEMTVTPPRAAHRDAGSAP